jgi:universal stress protein A
MQTYKKILIALELNEECDQFLLKKAEDLAAAGGKLYLIHAVEHMSNYGAAYGVSAGVDIEDILVKEAKEAMTNTASRFNVPADQQIVKAGPAKFLILEVAEKLGIDLIVVGSHGRHGVRLLLGSTANAVLHGANCDVLAVRVKE